MSSPQRLQLSQATAAECQAAALAVWRVGGLVIFPTETVYGAGVVATNQAAVDKLLKFKSRREGKPLSIAVSDQTMAQKYVELNDQALSLYQTFLPGPVTVVSKGLGVVANGVESEFGTLGVRIPDYAWVRGSIAALGQPITATSANASGGRRPYSIADVYSSLSERQKALIDLVIDAGQLPKNPPSTVIDTTLSTPVTLRQGAVQTTNDLSVENLVTHSAEETSDYAKRLGLKYWDALVSSGLMVCLDGPLGAGKSVFVRSLARYLGVTDTLASPTYTYRSDYTWSRAGHRGQLIHVDLWKVESAEQLARLELGSELGAGNLVCVEWSEAWRAELRQLAQAHSVKLIKIAIEPDAGDAASFPDLRRLRVQEESL